MSSYLQPCGSITALAADEVLRELRTFANTGATLRQHTVKKLTGGSRLRGATLGLHFGAATSGSRAVSLDVDDIPGKRLVCMFADLAQTIEIKRLMRVLVCVLLSALQLAWSSWSAK
jgi:hypothetical protein